MHFERTRIAIKKILILCPNENISVSNIHSFYQLYIIGDIFVIMYYREVIMYYTFDCDIAIQRTVARATVCYQHWDSPRPSRVPPRIAV